MFVHQRKHSYTSRERTITPFIFQQSHYRLLFTARGESTVHYNRPRFLKLLCSMLPTKTRVGASFLENTVYISMLSTKTRVGMWMLALVYL